MEGEREREAEEDRARFPWWGPPTWPGLGESSARPGSFQSVKCRGAFETREVTPPTRARTPPRRSSPPLPSPPHPCSTSAPCSLSSPLPAAPPLVPAKRIRVFSCRFAPFRRKARGRSVAHSVPSIGRRGSGTAVCGLRAAAPRLPVVLHARLHRDAGGSAQSCIHTGCSQTCASPDCSSQGRWPSTCQPRGPCRNHTTHSQNSSGREYSPFF